MNYDSEKVTYFAETDARNKHIKFGIKAKDRTKHVYVIGKTGMGKSTLLENMAIQDIQNGEGLVFVDPHGGTAEKLLDFVPENRIKDVLYFAPFDTEYPISFNVMEDIGEDSRHLVVSGLMSAFKKLFGEESFSDRMQYILQNTILALLEYPGATMLGINKMLIDKVYRKKVVDNITDSSVKTYWTKEFAGYTERFAADAIPAIQNKVGQFTSNPLIRNLIGQPVSTFDIRKIMDEQKIIIVNLSKGRVGESNANLLGSMLITKIYLAAMSRADKNLAELSKLPNFYLYVDEFQSFANESFADILSEARKYKLNLTIAHQYIEQMDEEVRDAVFGNVGTMIAFRVGAYDAEVLEKEFAPTFTIEDFVNLGFVQIYLKLMIDGVSSQPFSAMTMAPIAQADRSYREEIVASSRSQFAHPKAEVESAINAWLEEGTAKVIPKVDKNAVLPRSDSSNSFVKSENPRSAERKDKKELDKEKKAVFENIIKEEKNIGQPNIPKQNPITLKELGERAPAKDKNPSTAHMSELKRALEGLTKKVQGDVQKIEKAFNHPPQAQNSSQQQSKPQPSKPNLPQQQSNQAPNKKPPESQQPQQNKKQPVAEIPQDELLNMLKVDGK
jgi:energy-coupling factor transporter ATP-binding protein EcfA2